LPLSFAAEKDSSSGWLGIVIEEMSPAMLAALNIEYGVLIAEVIEDGPGAKAGLQMGDVILNVDGERVSSLMTLREVVRSRPGKKVEVVFLRRMKQQKVMVELGSRPGRVFFQWELSRPIELWRELRRVWRRVLPQLRINTDIYQQTLDSLQVQIEELRRGLLEMQKRLQEERR
jgi:predicted metalloprotease with PDZ domain